MLAGSPGLKPRTGADVVSTAKTAGLGTGEILSDENVDQLLAFAWKRLGDLEPHCLAPLKSRYSARRKLVDGDRLMTW